MVAVALTSCASPAIDAEGYRGKVGHSAEQLTGILGTDRLAGELDLNGRMLRSVTDTVVTDSENDATSVVSSFESVQPPDAASVSLRSQADDVLSQAASTVADLRIAVRRGDAAGMRDALGSIDDSLAALGKLRGQM